MQATMKQKNVVDEDDTIDRFGRPKKKIQSDFMKQLTDLAQQVPEPSPPPADLPTDETIPKGTEVPPGSSRAASRLNRPTPLRHPPPPKLVTPSKPARIPVKQPYIPVATESTQTVEARAKTPREFSDSFLRLMDKLKELHWFEEQYPLIKFDVMTPSIKPREFFCFSLGIS